MATNPHWVDRQAYAQICGAFVGVVDASLVTDELLPLMLMMVDDAVPNVRRELAKSLAIFQRHVAYAANPDLKDAIGTLMTDPHTDVCEPLKNLCAEVVFEGLRRSDEFTTGLRITPKK